MRLVPTLPLALSLCALLGCDNAPVAVRLSEVQRERTLWAAHHLTRYAYVYEVTGTLISFGGHPIHLVVLGDSVASAQDLTTDSLLPVSAALPTLDQLYDLALAALAGGTLTSITFDTVFNYPTRMDLAGPPDASGSILASHLELLP